MRFIPIALFAFVLAAACGDDTRSAVARCNELTELICARHDECGISTAASCETELRQEIDCSGAQRVGPSYDQCLADLRAVSCANFTALPAACRGVIEGE